MVPLSMTLSDLWPGFQGLDILKVEYRKMVRLEDKVTIVQEETIPNRPYMESLLWLSDL